MRWLRLLLIFCLVSPVWGAARIAVASTGFTTATTWGLVDASSTTGSSYLDSEAGTTAIPSPAASYSSNFLWAVTAPTVDGVAVKFATRAAVASGTITVILRDVTGGADVKTVTVNVSDINANAPQGWYFFKFDAATALVAANNYAIGVKSSAATQGTLYRDATAANWSRMLRTTTTAAPAANDQLHVLGEWTAAATVTARTVTMDETATTSYGPTVAAGPPQGFTIGKSGTLNWGTTAKTNYILYVKGILRIYPGGTMNIGTVGTPMPSTSTALYQMTSVANVDSGLMVDGTLSVYGATKTNVSTLLTADLGALGTVVQVADTTGWVANDVLGFASTTITPTQFENRIVQSVDSGVQVTLTVGVTNAHSGTAPTQGEVINLTRNVVIRGTSALLQGFIFLNATSAGVMYYDELYWMGSNTANKRAVDIQTTTGSLDIQYCSLHDSTIASQTGFYITGAASNNFTISNNVIYNVTNHLSLAATSGTAWTISANTFIGATGALVSLANVGGTFTNNRITSGAGASGALLVGNGAGIGTFSGQVVHSNTGNGITFDATPTGVVSGGSIWRNGNSSSTGGIGFATGGGNILDLTISSVSLFGNTQQNIYISRGTSYINGLVLNNLASNGDSTFATGNGIYFNVAANCAQVKIVDSNFGTAAGILTAHTNDLRTNPASANSVRVNAYNTTFASATLFSDVTSLINFSSIYQSGLFSMKQNGTAGNHKRYLTMGNALTNTGTFRTASPSEEIVPSSASVKMESGPKQAAVASGDTVTWSVWVYKSVGYAGAQPRLILRANPAIGVASDILLDTMAGAAGAWEELTGVTPAAAGDDGVFEAFVDCDTSGSIYVDDWSANGTLISENRGWWQGTPIVVAGVEPIGGDKYWWTGAPAIGFPPSGPAPGGTTPVFNNPILISRRETVGRP